MTAYAPNWTSRVRFSYFGAQKIHSLNLRFPGPITGSGLTDIITLIGNFQAALAPVLFEDWTFNATFAADQDSGVFLPQPNPDGAAGSILLTAFTPEMKAWAGVFVGRTALGNPAHFSVYGISRDEVQAAPGQNFRVIAGENATIDTAINVLQSNATKIVGNDGTPVTWYDYMNFSPNARAKKLVRKAS
jgi:hypothetical protein